MTGVSAASPLHDVMMAWQADSPPADWQVIRQRIYRLNVTCLFLALAAMICFLLALRLIDS